MELPADALGLDDAAAEIGVHYQTIYRWVRAGKLPADIVDGRYRIWRNDLTTFIDARHTPKRPQPPSAPRLTRAAQTMHTALTTGDEFAARDLAHTLVAEHTPLVDLIQQVLAPALQQIGRVYYCNPGIELPPYELPSVFCLPRLRARAARFFSC